MPSPELVAPFAVGATALALLMNASARLLDAVRKWHKQVGRK